MPVLLLALSAFPAHGIESIWIEGEAASATTFNSHGWYEGTDLRFDFMSPGEVEVSDGAWLAHYTNGVPADVATATWDFTAGEGGTYTWWLRCNPYSAVHRYSLDGGPFVDMDLSDPRERINIVQGIDIRWLAWVRVPGLDLAPGPHSLTLEVSYSSSRDEAHGGVDALCLVNHPWEPTGVLQPGQVVNVPAPGAWFVFHPGDDPHSPESLTDMSRFVEQPAGLHGPLQRVGDRFEFRDRAGVSVKIMGVNTGRPLATPALQRQQARLWRKHGFNLVRLHPVESFLGVLQDSPAGRVLDPARLDELDRWFALLKEEGIYSAWSLFYPHVITPADGYDPGLYAELPNQGAGKATGGFVTISPSLQAAEWDWASVLLSHVNPYTGLAYAQDPALAIVETRNEDSIFWHYPLNDLAGGTAFPLHTAELTRGWAEWLRGRHGDDAGLALAWGPGLRAGDSVDNVAMGIYGAWQMDGAGANLGAGIVPAENPRMGDFIAYLAELQKSGYTARHDLLRGIGYEGVFVTTAWMAGGASAEAANLWSDDAGDAIDRHSYFGGGAGGHWVTTGACSTATHLDRPGQALVGGHVYGSAGETVVLYQVEDKPVIMSEWTMSPPDPYKAEAAPLQTFYGMGLQGWDATIHFAASRPRLGGGWPSDARNPNSYVLETPAYLGQFPALALATHDGHLQEGPLAAARRVDEAEVFRGYDVLSQDLPTGGFPASGSLRVPPEVGAIGKLTFSAEPMAGLSSERLDWATWWDQAAQTIESVTGELHWDYGSRVVTVTAPKTHAVIGWAGGGSYDLPGVSVSVTTPFVSLLLSSLDDRPILESTHVLITALARDQPLNAQYSADGSQLLAVGGPPLLLEPVQAELTFLGNRISSARSVDPFGVPTATEIERTGNTITLDGRYQSYYYEVTLVSDEPTCLERTGVSSLAPLVPGSLELFVADATETSGWALRDDAPLADVPHVCPFATGDGDPDPVLDAGASPLYFYRVSGDLSGPIRLSKDLVTRSVRFSF